jgi:hypothetical protein
MLANLKRINSYEVQEMIDFIRVNIDPKLSICTNCPAQIRFAQRILNNWLVDNETKEEEVIMDEITSLINAPLEEVNNEVAIEVPPVIDTTQGCDSCKKKGGRPRGTKNKNKF